MLNLPWDASCLFILPKIKKKTIVPHGWMVVDMIFFSLDSYSPAKLSTVEGSKIGVHPTGWHQNFDAKMGVMHLCVQWLKFYNYVIKKICAHTFPFGASYKKGSQAKTVIWFSWCSWSSRQSNTLKVPSSNLGGNN